MNMNLKKWLDFVEGDKDLSQKLLLKRSNYDNDGRSFESFIKEVFLPEAKKHCFELSEKDVKEFIDATGMHKLSMDELEDVAGGRSKVLMNIGVVSMALMSILPMASMFTSENGVESNTSTAVVSTVKNEKNSDKNTNQKQNEKSQSVSGAQLGKVTDNQSAGKN